MRSIFLNITVVLVSITSIAQTIKKSSIDNGGASSSSPTLSALYTIGEVMVNEVSLGNLSVSEGFIGPISSCNLSLNQLPQNLELTYDGSSNTNEVNAWLNNNGNAIVGTSCGDVTWQYQIIDDILDDSNFDFVNDRLTLEIEFVAIDDEGAIVTSAFIIFNDFATAGESAGNGGAICENSFPVSNFDDDLFFENDGVDYTDQKYNSSLFEIFQTGGKPGLTYEDSTKKVKFPDSGAGQFTYNFDFRVETTVNIGTELPRIYETSTFYTANNVTVAFDPGPNITVYVCDFQNLNLLDLYNQLEIELDVDTSEFNEAEFFGNVFEPENSWYNETDDLEANPDIPPLTEITEPGVYQFNAKKFLEDCAGEPVFVTIVNEFNSVQSSQDLVTTYDIGGNHETEINTWLVNNGGVVLSVSENIVWTYQLDYYDLDTFSFSDSLFIYVIFTATDACGNQNQYFGTIEIQDFPIAGETNQGDGVICDRSINLNGINGIDFQSSTYSNSLVTVSGAGTIDGFNVDFPDTGAGQFQYGYSFSVTTNVSAGNLNIDILDTAIWDLPNVTRAFDPGPDKIVSEIQVNSLGDLFNRLDVVAGTNDPSFNPDEFWFNCKGESITSYSGPGNYIFNAESFLPDCGGISATVTVTALNPNLSLEIKAYLQGPYDTNNGLMSDNLRAQGYIDTTSPYIDELVCESSVFEEVDNDAIVDWVWVELRDENDNTNIISARSALLQRDGDVVDVDGASSINFNLNEGNYFIAISHRNHLGILTVQAIELNFTCVTSINFTNNVTSINGGTNAIKVMGDGNLALYASDFDGNGQIQNSDINGILPLLGTSFYSPADIDMNGQIQNTDINILLPNLGLGSQSGRYHQGLEPLFVRAPRR